MDQFSFSSPPPRGTPFEIAENIYWVQLGLPFQLDHVNLYLLRDGTDWTCVDAGVDGPETRAAWASLFDFMGGAQCLRRLIITHHHVDHVGAAGWVCAQSGCDILMSAVEFQAAKTGLLPAAPDRHERALAHLRWLGCALEEAETLASQPFRASQFAGPLPDAITVIAPGQSLEIAGRRWELRGGQGHSPAPLMLHCVADHLLVAGDQILSSISPFVGTFGDAPLASPLRDYLIFLDEVETVFPDHVLVMPGHGSPFRGVGARISTLKLHHQERLEKILNACRQQGLTTRGLLDHLFTRDLSRVMAMALAETLSHINLLVDSGEISVLDDDIQRVYRV